MKFAVFAFTGSGSALGAHLCEKLRAKGEEALGYTMEKFAAESGLVPFELSPAEEVKLVWGNADALIFVGATGIAVRMIAPLLQSKAVDPAVLSCDERGDFIISLASGHIGGANELAYTLAEITGGQAVISTATDICGKFAVDVFARRNGLAIENLSMAKDISAAVLADEAIGFVSDFPVEGQCPTEISYSDAPLGIAVTVKQGYTPFAKTLRLFPKILHLGVGCRRGTSVERLNDFILRELHANNLSLTAAKGIFSIDLKKDEEGLLALAQMWNLPFVTYSKEELASLMGDFSSSEFVKNTVGVDNVCERAAVFGGGKLVLHKKSENGMTFAVAMEDWSGKFD